MQQPADDTLYYLMTTLGQINQTAHFLLQNYGSVDPTLTGNLRTIYQSTIDAFAMYGNLVPWKGGPYPIFKEKLSTRSARRYG